VVDWSHSRVSVDIDGLQSREESESIKVLNHLYSTSRPCQARKIPMLLPLILKVQYRVLNKLNSGKT
jgi:hypothetical protein